MNGYRIVWRSARYGTSFVQASSPEEARKLAEQNKDEGFEPDDDLHDWDIESVELFDA